MTVQPSALDGPHRGWMQSSTCRAVQEAGNAAGRAYGLAESISQELARLLNRQAKQKFGSTDDAGRATLDALARAFAFNELQELAKRLVASSSWAEWLAGVVVPPPAPDLPDYTKNIEIDLESSGPSIDTYAKASMFGGGQAIIHLRFQKWYQPDLDRHLFESSRKLERKYGKMPMVLVILMWPAAEGPDMTGRFEERDAQGKVKHVR